MKTRMIRLDRLIASMFLACCGSAFAQEQPNTGLDLAKGTMQMGGEVLVDTQIDLYEEGSDASVGLSFSPSMGYFLTDGFEVYGGPSYATAFDDRTAGYHELGLFFGIRYFFEVGNRLHPYMGVTAGSMVSTFDGFQSADYDIRAGIGAGVLIALNAHAGLSLGGRANYLIKFVDSDEEATGNWWSYWEMPMGYLGVSAFF